MGIKTTVWYFKQQTSEIFHEKIWTCLKRETESLPRAAQNNTLRINYIKTKIHNTQQNSSCKLYDDKDETINHILSECSKLAQKKYKSWRDRVKIVQASGIQSYNQMVHA